MHKDGFTIAVICKHKYCSYVVYTNTEVLCEEPQKCAREILISQKLQHVEIWTRNHGVLKHT